MKFLNLKSKAVDFSVYELSEWVNRKKLDIDIETLSWSKGVLYSRIRASGISTFHSDEYCNFYCDHEFIFFTECHNDFWDDEAKVRKIFFDRTRVTQERVGSLLLEISNLSETNSKTFATDHLDIWKAESCELALAG